MKLLIIGGSRFVGPLLVRLLSENNHQITVFNRGHYPLSYPQNVRFVKGDRDLGFGSLKEKFDVVIDTCAYREAQTAKALRELNFDFFVHFSTIAVYRKTEAFPLTEESPLGEGAVFSDYGRGKRGCEEVLQKSGLPYATLRPTYILGPRNYLEREIFIYQRLKNNQPLILPGNGQAVVQFVFADEVAKSLALLAEKKAEGAFNCCGDDKITLRGLGEEMAKIVGVPLRLQFNPKTDGEKHDENEFPFANETLLCSNLKIKQLGVTFTPLLVGLKRDYESYYKDKLV